MPCRRFLIFGEELSAATYSNPGGGIGGFVESGTGTRWILQPLGASRERYFVIVCLVGETVDVGAAFEIAKVSHTFQPSGRFSDRNSR